MKNLVAIALTLFVAGTAHASLESELVQTYVKTADLLSQARNQNLTCDVSAYQSEIIETLRKTNYRSSFHANMISSEIKKALAGTIYIKEVLGEVKLEDADTAEYQKALLNTYFEAPAAGVYGPQETFVLKSGGVIELSTLQILDEEPWSNTVVTSGKWGVNVKQEKGNKIVRLWFTVKNKTRVYRLERSYQGHDNGWILQTKPRPSQPEYYQNIKFYNGKMSECEA